MLYQNSKKIILPQTLDSNQVDNKKLNVWIFIRIIVATVILITLMMIFPEQE
jgi:hypothetical protein